MWALPQPPEMQSPSTAPAFLVQSSNTGPAPALLASHPGIKNKEKNKKPSRKQKDFILQEILFLEEEVERRMTSENAAVLFKSRLAIGGSLCRSPLCPPGIALK